MKDYVRYSAAWKRQKKTQRNQRAAEARGPAIRRTDGQRFLHPERHRKTKAED